MDTFTTICLCMIPSAVVWHVFFIFFANDSRYQKYRFRKALDKLCEAQYDKLDIIYKNKRFSVEVVFNNINSVYGYYEIFINDQLAATYHKLNHACMKSYYFKEENKRHRGEVESIIYAALSVLKDKEKPKKIKNDGYTEYSFFN